MNEYATTVASHMAGIIRPRHISDRDFRRRHFGRLRAILWFTMLVLCVGLASAQDIPGQATPGGALPEPLNQWELPQTSAPEIVIPPVFDRPLSEEDGPRIAVRAFSLIFPEAATLPALRAELTARAEAVLKTRLEAQPGSGFTVAALERAANEVATVLRKAGLILAQAYVPVQTVTDGVVEIHVLEGRLGGVSPKDNKRYSAKLLMSPFLELVGRPVMQTELEGALLRLTDYPGLVAFGVLGTGARPGETELSLRVSKERVIEWAADMDNYGAESTGEIRTQFNFQWNNPTGAGDVVQARLLQSFDPANNAYGSLSYERPVFDHRFDAGIALITSDYDVGQSFAGLGVNGRTYIATGFLQHQIKRSRSLNLHDRFSLSLKRGEVEVLGNQLSEDKLSVLEAGIGFDWINVRGRSANQGYLAYNRGVEDLFGAMDLNGDDASSVRGGSNERAGGRFDKWTLRFVRRQYLTDHQSLQFRMFAQYSDDLLTSLEQLAVGGPFSVRAYAPSEVLVDMGGFGTLEWIVAPGKILEFSIFAEYGGGKLSDPRSSQFETTDISGYGLGLDVKFSRFRARLDVAKPHSKLETSNRRDPQYYLTFGYGN